MVFDSGRLIFRIFMRFSWDVSGIVVVFDSGRPIFGIFMGFLWDCCGVRFWSAHLRDFYGIFVGFLWNCCGILWDCYGVCFWLARNYRTNSGIAMVSKQIVFLIHSDRLLFKWVLLPSCNFNGLVLGLFAWGCGYNLLLMSKPAAIEFGICCGKLRI